MLKIDSQLENQTEPRLAGQPTDLDAIPLCSAH